MRIDEACRIMSKPRRIPIPFVGTVTKNSSLTLTRSFRSPVYLKSVIIRFNLNCADKLQVTMHIGAGGDNSDRKVQDFEDNLLAPTGGDDFFSGDDCSYEFKELNILIPLNNYFTAYGNNTDLVDPHELKVYPVFEPVEAART